MSRVVGSGRVGVDRGSRMLFLRLWLRRQVGRYGGCGKGGSGRKLVLRGLFVAWWARLRGEVMRGAV